MSQTSAVPSTYANRRPRGHRNPTPGSECRDHWGARSSATRAVEIGRRALLGPRLSARIVLPPDCLVRYSARSADRLASRALHERSAIPMLTVTGGLLVERLTAVVIRSASAPVLAGSSTANSSPPSRAANFATRIAPRMARPTATSVWSPVSWP